ncbi:hypothetical protein M404DRAFT_1005274 [Pisolithus tinctorius Marx 270]|uniref:Uncharacterized protein n=1 Tax=Pisolithus tinctorius Marx 270 TaxID=870435 RepID=A0A0C3INN3_PISTI|nr:hypothetical protein M404DRAFT_1005274 [Pisolithus tinctorius Marx 270]
MNRKTEDIQRGRSTCSKPRYGLNGNRLRTLNAPLHRGEAVGVHSNSSVFHSLDAAGGSTASKQVTEWDTDCAGKPHETNAIFSREKDLEMIKDPPRSAGNT